MDNLRFSTGAEEWSVEGAFLVVRTSGGVKHHRLSRLELLSYRCDTRRDVYGIVINLASGGAFTIGFSESSKDDAYKFYQGLLEALSK